jgi:hypothetical protein
VNDGELPDDSLVVEEIELSSAEPVRLGGREPIEHRQETARVWIAGGLLALLGIMMLATFLGIMIFGVSWDSIRDPVTYLVGVLVGLVGTVVGFYFGAKSG